MTQMPAWDPLPSPVDLTVQWLRVEFSAELTTDRVGRDMPEDVVMPFIRVTRSGGILDDIGDHPQIQLEVWGPREGDQQAEWMSNQIGSRTPRLGGAHTVDSLSIWVCNQRVITGPFSQGDPDTGLTRYITEIAFDMYRRF